MLGSVGGVELNQIGLCARCRSVLFVHAILHMNFRKKAQTAFKMLIQARSPLGVISGLEIQRPGRPLSVVSPIADERGRGWFVC